MILLKIINGAVLWWVFLFLKCSHCQLLLVPQEPALPNLLAAPRGIAANMGNGDDAEQNVLPLPTLISPPNILDNTLDPPSQVPIPIFNTPTFSGLTPIVMPNITSNITTEQVMATSTLASNATSTPTPTPTPTIYNVTSVPMATATANDNTTVSITYVTLTTSTLTSVPSPPSSGSLLSILQAPNPKPTPTPTMDPSAASTTYFEMPASSNPTAVTDNSQIPQVLLPKHKNVSSLLVPSAKTFLICCLTTLGSFFLFSST